MSKVAHAFVIASLAGLIVACQTQKAATILDPPEPNAIKASSTGFSPTGDEATRNMRLALLFGNKTLPQAWSVEIATGSVVVKRFEGSGSGDQLPSEVVWDGRTESGAVWPEGEYYAILSSTYGGAYNPSRAVWDKFYLASSAPSVALSADPSEFTPEGQGMAAPVTIGIEAKAPLAAISSWQVSVRDGSDTVVKSFSGDGASAKAVWDGSIEPSGYAEPSKSYMAVAEVRDEYGNVGRASLPIAVREQESAPEASLVEAESGGFSPTSDKNGGGIDLSLKYGSREAMRAWRVEVSGSGIIRRTFEGRADEAPATLLWDGRDNQGTLCPEGEYSAALVVDYGRTYKAAVAKSKDFVLSIAPPDCSLSATPNSFEPSEKGVSTPMAILLDATPHMGRIDSWSLDILDAQGKTVREFNMKWPENQALWDGMVSDKVFVEPGASYLAKATILDEFGNRSQASLAIGVKDIPNPTEPSLIEPRSAGFSPTGQGKPRAVDFILVAGDAAKVRGWKVVISHTERGAQRVFTGTAADLKKRLSWDGRTDSGDLAPDGNYVALLTIDYGKSFKPASARSPAFALQAAAPDVALELAPARLTPQAGDFQSPISIGLSASARFAEIESWIVSVLDANGKTVALFKDSTPGGTVSWNGHTNSGGLAEPAMTYSVLAEVRDSFGNTGTAQALLPVDDLPLVPGQAAITPSAKGFSPNSDGAMDTIGFSLAVPNPDSVNAWKVQIAQADGLIRKTFSGDASSLKDALTWAGRDDAGSPAPEGIYTASMSVDYGSVYKAISVSSRKFVLALTPPKGKLQTGPDAVVPDEDGLVAPATIALDGSSALAQMASWKVEVVDASGKSFGSYQGAWPPGRLAWGGVAADGSLASPGAAYQVTAAVTDEFGLSTKLQPSIQVGDLPKATEPSQVAALAPGFSPRSGGAIKFSLSFGNKNLVKGWSLDIERDDRTVRMRFPGDPSALPDSFSWNGLLQDGSVAPDGMYSARLNLDYGRAYARASASSQVFTLVATAPTGTIAIDPQLFSPDGSGGSADTIAISLDASSRFAKINDWSVEIQDPGGNSFASFHGLWPAGQIKWDGRNAKGELVESAEDYPVTARVRDEFGNTLELKSAVNVDILIVKMGDGYRIRIASIVFKPFTADFLDVAPDIAERNVSTLNLLAEKLKKFPGYQIRMVGHAVMVNWDNPALGKVEQEKELIPLSKARAEAIMQALAQRGIDPARMVTDGVGSSDQIVSDSDFADRWKNRRVEFFLQRK